MIIPPDRKISTSIVGFWNFPSNLILRFKKIPFFLILLFTKWNASAAGWTISSLYLLHLFVIMINWFFFLRCRFQCIRNINQFKTKSAVLRQTTCALSWERDQEKKMIKLISICRLNYITNFNIIGSDRKSKVQTLDCLRCVGWCLAFHNNERILVRYLRFNVETK